jgi:mRNA interferase MazF
MVINKFNNWNKNKILIEKSEYNKIFSQWEIWYTKIWKNVWYEEDWKWKTFSRPVLIFKKFNRNIFYGIPLTSVKKENIFHYSFDWKTWKISYAILSQMRLIDWKRLEEKIWYITFSDMKKLKEQLKKLIL